MLGLPKFFWVTPNYTVSISHSPHALASGGHSNFKFIESPLVYKMVLKINQNRKNAFECLFYSYKATKSKASISIWRSDRAHEELLQQWLALCISMWLDARFISMDNGADFLLFYCFCSGFKYNSYLVFIQVGEYYCMFVTKLVDEIQIHLVNMPTYSCFLKYLKYWNYKTGVRRWWRDVRS